MMKRNKEAKNKEKEGTKQIYKDDTRKKNEAIKRSKRRQERRPIDKNRSQPLIY